MLPPNNTARSSSGPEARDFYKSSDLPSTTLNRPDRTLSSIPVVMPPLPGFSDNPFRTHADLLAAVLALLKPLTAYFSPGKARIRFANSTGAHFDEGAAQLEGFARPLWAVGSLGLLLSTLCDQSSKSLPADSLDIIQNIIQEWSTGLATGTDPSHAEYWGGIPPTERCPDQRMVEAEMVAFALLAAPEAFYHTQEHRTQDNIRVWLDGMRQKKMPTTNWLWFRVFSLLALVKVCGTPFEDLKEEMEADLGALDEFYLRDGWSSDGVWLSDEENTKTWHAVENGMGRHADYYSGSFAIQFSQLLFTKFADDLFPEQREVFWQRARDFGAHFWRYFDESGAAIPYGRSLTYRFACGAFFAAVGFVRVADMPEPLATLGKVKGFLLRHLRWWADRSTDVFGHDGVMNIGWLYPNMYMAEDYNSPQSVYWCLKSLIVVSLPQSHAFWTEEELSFPYESRSVQPLSAPLQILAHHSSGRHHFLLNSGQFVAWPLKASQAKYTKFAYSSAFGFSVPTGALIAQIAPDSTIALSRDSGETWALKWKRDKTRFGTATIDGESVPVLISRWWPWSDLSVEIDTFLIPPSDLLPDWHFRVHKVRGKSNQRMSLKAVEGGFAIQRQMSSDGFNTVESRYTSVTRTTAVAVSDESVSAVMNLTGFCTDKTSRAVLLKPDANTNLLAPRTVIPVIEHQLDLDASEIVLMIGVFAIASVPHSSNGPGWPEVCLREFRRPQKAKIVLDDGTMFSFSFT